MRMLVLGDARQTHTFRWIRALAAAGVEVEAVSYEAPLSAAPVPLHLLPASGPKFLRSSLALPAAMEIAERFRPDALSALFVPDYGLLASRLAGRLARAGGTRPKLLVVPLGSDLLRNAGRTPFHRARARGVLASADRIAVDADLLAAAARKLGAPGARLVRVDWRPDLEVFAHVAEKPPGAMRIISTRQHAPVYDLATLVRAAIRLRQRRSDFELVLAGDGPLRPRLAALAAPLGGSVRFTGRMGAAELAALLGSSAVYVSTARSDSTSVSLLEAMACGAFPVVTGIEGNREWVEEGSSGLLFRAGDDQGLARQLGRALDDAVLRERATGYNRRRLEKMPSFEEAVRGLALGL